MHWFRFLITVVLSLSLSLTVHVAWGSFPLEPSTLNAQQLKNPQQPTQLLIEGKTQYDRGRFSEAVGVWQQAAQGFSNEGNLLGEAQALSFLSLGYQRLGEYERAREAIAIAKEKIADLSGDSSDRNMVLAQVLNAEGRLQWLQGQPERALELWQQAAVVYGDANDKFGEAIAQINQARAMQALGLYRRATNLLENIEQNLAEQSDSGLKAAGLLSLGDLRRQGGALQESERLLQQALVAIKSVRSPEQHGAILLSLGNTVRGLGNTDAALQFYQEAEEKARQIPVLQLEAQLNRLSLLVETSQWELASQLAGEISEPLTVLPPSRPAVYAQVNWVKNSICLEEKNANCLRQEIGDRAEALLQTDRAEALLQALERAVTVAKTLGDKRAESYALGNLGRLYEEMGDRDRSLEYTEAALNIAQLVQAGDIAYQWQWQLGRLRFVKGDKAGAIVAYSEAVNTLQSLRNDLVAIDATVQFSFRDRVEPVYRQLVALLLDRAKQAEPNLKQEYLTQVRATVESLQLAELDNYFKDACLDVTPEQIDEIDPKAAAIYPIVLPDRLAVILSIQGQPLTTYETAIDESEIDNILGQLQQFLNPAFSNRKRLELSQQVYDWLIRPAEAALEEREIQTLVFVPDGFLRNLPMAALHDGERYLIETYSIALTPGLQLLAPRPLIPENLKVLSAGLTDARQGFEALPEVALELQEIATQVPTTKLLLDREFTESNLARAIERVDFPVIHLATHGQFSSNSEQTFILTWDDKIQVTEFEELLKTREAGFTEPIELLVLSACQTAAGDKEAGLGLAGVAVRSGARSTLATLWAVNDRSTALLVTEFYRQLTGGSTHELSANSAQLRKSKAEALRQGQLVLLRDPKYEHPFYWAPFVLVGNWL